MPVILIAEDHSVVRMGAILIMEDMFADVTIVEAETFDEIISHLKTNRSFDLLLLDIHIPGGDSLQMIEAIKLRSPNLPILIFSSYEEQLYATSYIKAGAIGYLHKRAAPEEVKIAVRKAITGEKYVSEDIQKQLLNELFSNSEKNNLSKEILSPRETEIMQLLIKGASTAEIKTNMHIHDSTISTYKSRIFTKMKVRNIIELAEKVRMLGG